MVIAARERRLLALVAALGLAASANAEQYLFSGEHAIRFSHNGNLKEVSAAGGPGVALVNEAGSGTTLKTLELTRPFATIDATVTSTPGVGVDELRFDGVRINRLIAGPGGSPGLFAPIFTAAQAAQPLTANTLPAAGTLRICNVSGCPSSIAVNLSQTTTMGLAIGPGVGGTFMVGGTGPTQITVMGAPWTIGTTTVSYRTQNGGTGTFQEMGFVKGPLSGASSTLPSGTVQLVSGIQTTALGLDGGNDLSGQIARLTLTFAPEPRLLLLLGAGSVAMVVIGRKRIRR